MIDKKMIDDAIKHKLSLLSIILSSIILSSIVVPPAYASPKDELDQTKKEMAKVEEHKAELAAQNEKLQNELKDLQNSLVGLADAIQKSEAALSDCEDKERNLGEQMKAQNAALAAHQKNLTMLVNAALSLSRTPIEAMMMMPTGAMDSIKAARALKMTSDDIRKETQAIAQQMSDVKKLQQQAAQNHQLLSVRQQALTKERKDLTDHLAERAQLQQKLGQQQKQEDAKLAGLAKKAQNLQELIAAIEKEAVRRKAEVKHEEATKDRNDKTAKMRSFARAQGRIRAPAVGSVVQSFGSSEGRNATSKGVIVNTRAGARVTAPYDGEVVFSGPFLGYGQMVILRHSDEFHTLLAGMSNIDVQVGQFLLEGEPIGAMGESGNRLYVEVRKNNQPVDPALWINGLK